RLHARGADRARFVDAVKAVALVVETIGGQGEKAAFAIADQLRVGRFGELFASGGHRPVQAVLRKDDYAVLQRQHVVYLVALRFARAAEQRVAVSAAFIAAAAEQFARVVEGKDEVVSAGSDDHRSVLVNERGRVEEIRRDGGGKRRGAQKRRRQQRRQEPLAHDRHLVFAFFS